MKPPGLAVRPAARVGQIFRSRSVYVPRAACVMRREGPFFCRCFQTWVVCNPLRSKSFVVHESGFVRVKSCFPNGLNPLNRFFQCCWSRLWAWVGRRGRLRVRVLVCGRGWVCGACPGRLVRCGRRASGVVCVWVGSAGVVVAGAGGRRWLWVGLVGAVGCLVCACVCFRFRFFHF